MTTRRERPTGQASLNVVNILALVGVIAVTLLVGHLVWRPKPEPPPSVTTFITQELQPVAQLVATKDHVYAIVKYDPREKLFGFIPVRREHVLAVVRGYVNLGIDLQHVPPPNFNEATKTATMTVPHAAIQDVVTEDIDYVSVNTGVLFHFTPSQAHQVDSIAKAKLRVAAESLGVRQRADSNTVKALTSLFAKNGYNLAVSLQ